MSPDAQEWRDWTTGWHLAEADDANHTDPQAHTGWPGDRERGYRDYWTHPQGHEKRVLQADHEQYRGAALRPDPEVGR
jgi:hypothetical protein